MLVNGSQNVNTAVFKLRSLFVKILLPLNILLPIVE